MFTIVGSSTEQPIELVPGTPSAPAVLAGGHTAHYSLEIADRSNDLILAVTLFEGGISTTLGWNVTRPSDMPSCTSSLPASCNGQWDDLRSGSSHVITILGSFPCLTPPAKLPCSPSLAWRPGKVSGVLCALVRTRST